MDVYSLILKREYLSVGTLGRNDVVYWKHEGPSENFALEPDEVPVSPIPHPVESFEIRCEVSFCTVWFQVCGTECTPVTSCRCTSTSTGTGCCWKIAGMQHRTGKIRNINDKIVKPCTCDLVCTAILIRFKILTQKNINLQPQKCVYRKHCRRCDSPINRCISQYLGNLCLIHDTNLWKHCLSINTPIQFGVESRSYTFLHLYINIMMHAHCSAGWPCCEMALQELRRLIYQIVLDRNDNHVIEYGRVPREELKTMKVPT